MKKLISTFIVVLMLSCVINGLSQNLSAGGLVVLKTQEQVESKISPNPAASEITLRIEGDVNFMDNYQIEIYDVVGNKVKTVAHIDRNDYSIDVSDLEIGMYFYFLLKHDEKINSGRLIVKR